jgi:hypothetical protein
MGKAWLNEPILPGPRSESRNPERNNPKRRESLPLNKLSHRLPIFSQNGISSSTVATGGASVLFSDAFQNRAPLQDTPLLTP